MFEYICASLRSAYLYSHFVDVGKDGTYVRV